MTREILGLVAVLFAGLLIGCGLGGGKSTVGVSYVVTGDERQIVFNDLRGGLFVLDVASGDVMPLELGEGVFAMPALSASTDELAVAKYVQQLGIHPTIQLYRWPDLAALSHEPFAGVLSCFSPSGQYLYYARAERYTPPAGFSGNTWSDWDIWYWDRAAGTHVRVTDQRFSQVTGLAVDPATDTLYFSAMRAYSPNRNWPFEGFRIAADGTPEQVGDCSQLNLAACTNEPAFKTDGSQWVFVSDRQQMYHYLLYEQAGDNAPVEVTGFPQSRYFQQPRYGATSGAIYTLLSQGFDSSSRPLPELWRRDSAGEAKQLLTDEQLQDGRRK